MFDLTPDALKAAAVFVVPGLVASRFYRLLVPGVRETGNDALLSAVAYSLINWVLVSPVLARVSPNAPFYVSYSVWLLSVLGVPILLAVACYTIRTKRLLTRWLDNPIPTAWDYVFRQRREHFLRFTLKTGDTIVGYYGSESYSTAYPVDPEVYVERLCRTSQSGKIEPWDPASRGFLVRLADCRLVEFFDVTHEEQEHEQ